MLVSLMNILTDAGLIAIAVVRSIAERMLTWKLNKIYGRGAVARMSVEQKRQLARVKPEDRAPSYFPKDDASFDRFIPKSQASIKDLQQSAVQKMQLDRLVADPDNPHAQEDMGIAVAKPDDPIVLVDEHGKPVAYLPRKQYNPSPEYQTLLKANWERITGVEASARLGYTPDNPPVNVQKLLPMDEQYGEPVPIGSDEMVPLTYERRRLADYSGEVCDPVTCDNDDCLTKGCQRHAS